MFKGLVATLLVALATACSAGPRWTWEHNWKTEAETRQDLEACRSEAAQELSDTFAGATPLGFGYTEEKNDLVRQCMERKGYFYRETVEEEERSGAAGRY